MELTEIKDAFDGFTRDAKSALDAIRTDLAKEKKDREALELKIGRMGLTGFARSEPDAVDRKALNDAFRAFIRTGDERLLNEIKATSALSVGSDPGGGYTVFPAFSQEMTRKVFESSPIRPYARIVQISTDAFEELIDNDEAAYGWVGERGSRTDTDSPELGKLRIPVNEIYAMPKVTQKLLDDASIDIAGWLVNKVADRFARVENSAFFSGNGVGKPFGFLSYPTSSATDATRPWGTVQYVATGNGSGFASSNPADALIDLVYSLKSAYRPKAIFYMSRATAGVVRKFKDGQGNYLWSPAAVAGQPDQLLGHPVVLAEDMPAIAGNAFPVAFGDFSSGYTIVDRHGERLLQDPYTDKPNVRFYTYKRVGGAVTNFEAIKLLKVATS